MLAAPPRQRRPEQCRCRSSPTQAGVGIGRLPDFPLTGGAITKCRLELRYLPIDPLRQRHCSVSASGGLLPVCDLCRDDRQLAAQQVELPYRQVNTQPAAGVAVASNQFDEYDRVARVIRR